MWAILVFAALSFFPVAGSAAPIQILFSSLDLVYNGSSVDDATRSSWWGDNPADADSLSTMNCIKYYRTEGYSDLLTSSGGWGLALAVPSDFQVIYNQSPANSLGIGLCSNIPAQSLPFYPAIGEPVQIPFSTGNLTNLPSSGGSLARFHASGTGEVAGPIHKPTILLLGTGLVGIASFARRRMRKVSPGSEHN